MGDGEQDVRRRAEEWSEVGAVRLGPEGRRDAEARGGSPEARNPPARLTALGVPVGAPGSAANRLACLAFDPPT